MLYGIYLCDIIVVIRLLAEGKPLSYDFFWTLQVREGRKQSLPECLKKEFRLTINILRSVVTGDVYEVLRLYSE
jgi:hypothetical protein